MQTGLAGSEYPAEPLQGHAEAATQRDYTLAMGMILVYTILLFVMNTLVDLSYGVMDPRVKLK